MHDAELMARVAAGETEPFGTIVDRHRSIAMARALSILQNRAQAEDAVQDAFIDAWRRAGSYRPELGSVRSWLLRIVHNRSVDVHRRHAHQTRVAETVGAQPTATHPDPLEDVARRESADRMLRAIRELPAVQREVLGRAYYADQTLSQVAEATGAPLGTTKSRSRAGLAQLRELLAA